MLITKVKTKFKQFLRSLKLNKPAHNQFIFGQKLLSDIALDFTIKNLAFSSVLDIGSGAGVHADIFASEGKSVTRFDFGKSRAYTDKNDVIVGDFVNYEFSDKYDLVWASHVLEHTIHTHEFLTKLLAVSSKNGFVAITVPPAKSEFVGGHVTLWTPALLLYRMVLAGFDCKEAVVLNYGYNISVICPAKRNQMEMNDLAWDFNDIERLSEWLPDDIVPRMDGARYGKTYRSTETYLF
ncbi:class I SAM-dependent methyltransferase [Brumicola blandensis]|uniref:Methyltransferase domain-containing protein n=1 Tax=Brumicola blandensis TaxID=3075611 RepID=A0AAW8R2P1_9ALTE|nr:methyltransferase domain-containing protein [Alteromonas sp. W409]MDT0582704.1 methyltransferase domain-containing protein [Alteromonas sp. W409]